MRGRRVFCLITIVMMVTFYPFYWVTEISADMDPKTIQGEVVPNSSGQKAYPGNVTFYIQNRTNEGRDIDMMYTGGGIEYYLQAIEDSIINWEMGDPGVITVDVENGTYMGEDRKGYVAFSTDILNASGVQTFPTVELQKVPAPNMAGNGSGFINISWNPLNNTNGLVAGYTVYRSLTNDSDLSWSLVGGTVNTPLNDMWFNDTSVTEGIVYHYSVKVCFIGYQNNTPGQVDNYQSKYFGEGSVPMTATSPGGIPGAPSELRVHKGGEEWGGIPGDIVLNWTAPVIDFGFLVKNIVYYDLDITDGFQYTNFIEFDPNASAGGDPDWCILPGWDADSNNYAFLVRTTGDNQGGLENLTGTNIGYKYIMTLHKNPGPGTKFKWISIPYHSDYTMASDICGPMEEFTDNSVIDTLVRWNYAAQGYDSRHWALFPPPAHWQDDFAIEPGDALGVIVTTDVPYNWSIVGSHSDSLQFNLTKNPPPNTNFKMFSLPYHKAYYNASDISGPGKEFTDNSIIEVIAQWNFSTQDLDRRVWVSFPTPDWNGDFAIALPPGEAMGFIITSSTPYYWKPEVITL